MSQAEIIAAPFTLYLAPVGTAFPELHVAPSAFSAEWVEVGSNGNRNYSEAGVTVSEPQTLASFQGAGSTVPSKVWRTDEGIEVALELADLSPTQFALAFDDATVTKVAGKTGTPGKESFSMKKGTQVHLFAALLRGPSTVEEGLNSQFTICSCYQGSSPSEKFATKGGPAMLALQFIAIEQTTGQWVDFEVETPE